MYFGNHESIFDHVGLCADRALAGNLMRKFLGKESIIDGTLGIFIVTVTIIVILVISYLGYVDYSHPSGANIAYLVLSVLLFYGVVRFFGFATVAVAYSMIAFIGRPRQFETWNSRRASRPIKIKDIYSGWRLNPDRTVFVEAIVLARKGPLAVDLYAPEIFRVTVTADNGESVELGKPSTWQATARQARLLIGDESGTIELLGLDVYDSSGNIFHGNGYVQDHAKELLALNTGKLAKFSSLAAWRVGTKDAYLHCKYGTKISTVQPAHPDETSSLLEKYGKQVRRFLEE